MTSDRLLPSLLLDIQLWAVRISVVSYQQSLESMLNKAKLREPFAVEYIAVNNLISAVIDRDFKKTLTQFDLVLPDGKPIHWILKYFLGQQQSEHATAREQMLSICAMAVEEKVSIYLYGSTEETLDRLRLQLLKLYPELRIANTRASVFRVLSNEEKELLIKDFNDCGAGFIFVALGCPLQEQFIASITRRVNAVMLCVGSAFEIHAQMKRLPPRWVTQIGMEWLFRLLQDPRRLWKRYLFTNTLFILLLTFSAGWVAALKIFRCRSLGIRQ